MYVCLYIHIGMDEYKTMNAIIKWIFKHKLLRGLNINLVLFSVGK